MRKDYRETIHIGRLCDASCLRFVALGGGFGLAKGCRL